MTNQTPMKTRPVTTPYGDFSFNGKQWIFTYNKWTRPASESLYFADHRDEVIEEYNRINKN